MSIALPLVALAVALGAPAAGSTAPIRVCANGCDFASIQAAIDASASGGKIVIEPGVYVGPLTVDRNLRLDGAGADQTAITVPAGDGRVLTIAPLVSAVVTGVTIIGGTDVFGGGVLNEPGALLTLRGSVIRDNSASQVGGAIFNEPGATLAVVDSILANNTASFGGGAIVNPGGTVTLKNSTVTGNRVLYAGAGGIGNNGTMTLTDSTVSDNAAPAGSGGGIFNNPNGVLTVLGTAVTSNGAGLSGGGVFNRGLARLVDSTVSGNTAGIDGGGIYLSAGSVILQDTSVTGNVPDNCAPLGIISGCTD